MPTGPARRSLRALALVLAGPISAAAASDARADDLCVNCTGPQATYVCRTDLGTSKLANAGAKLLCASQLARRFGHERCRVRRAADTGACLGDVVTLAPEQLLSEPPAVAVQDPAGPAAAQQPPAPLAEPMSPTTAPAPPEAAGPFATVPPQEAQPAQPEPHANTADDPKPDTPPRTMEELAKKAAESSKEGLSKAGEAVGDAAKKTWNCLSSLLTDC